MESLNLKENKYINDSQVETFNINDSILQYSVKNFPFTVNSFPREYRVSTIKNIEEYRKLLIQSDFIIIDKNIELLYPLPVNIKAYIFRITATECEKNLDTVLALINKLIEQNISKGSNLISIGGGIIQDISAAACALFRRGQPFTYLPTTTLGQLDSCVGAKCALNTKKAKNIVGLFSAPKKVVIPIFMINSMPIAEHRAGLSEMLRLCLTASNNALSKYLNLLENILDSKNINLDSYEQALKLSLSIKKSVVDFDEYEKDVRRSMNYGHTFGHAIEKLVAFKIPHGLGVLLGIHMSNTFAYNKKSMNEENYREISIAIRKTLNNINTDFSYLIQLQAEEIIEQFKFDKKGDGVSVPLIMIEKPGKMIFYKYKFGSNNEILIKSIQVAIQDFVTWTKEK